MKRITIQFFVAASLLVMSTAAVAQPPARVKLFSSQVLFPICIAHAPGFPQKIYVCERTGGIRILDKDTGVREPGYFLDISAKVDLQQDNGLLGLAFAPDYATSGYFYVNYRSATDIILERYTAVPGSFTADPGSAYTIWKYPRPLGHNGGWIGFKPGASNQYLYISSGDGDLGGTYDFAQRAQTIVNQPMGKMLRIDVSGDDFPADPLRNYRIVPSNPFVGVTGDDEIWSFGLRNPWRCSFDRATGDLYVADVGMDSWEEINIEASASTGGRNYGWPCMEGAHCAQPPDCACITPQITVPAHDYPHPAGGSVTGGYVYRGSAIPQFQGLYFFGDFLRAKVWSARPNLALTAFTELTERTAEFTIPGANLPVQWISTFGEDASGELYICNIYVGRIYKIVPFPCLPEIDSQPTPIRPNAGSIATLRVVGAGAPPLTYRWRKNMINLEDGGRISGAFTPTLSIASVQASDEGSYDVVLTTPCGDTMSNTVMVDVFICSPTDFDDSGSTTVADVFAFLTAWFAGHPDADFNVSGSVTVADIFHFLEAWFAGC